MTITEAANVIRSVSPGLAGAIDYLVAAHSQQVAGGNQIPKIPSDVKYASGVADSIYGMITGGDYTAMPWAIHAMGRDWTGPDISSVVADWKRIIRTLEKAEDQ